MTQTFVNRVELDLIGKRAPLPLSSVEFVMDLGLQKVIAILKKMHNILWE